MTFLCFFKNARAEGGLVGDGVETSGVQGVAPGKPSGGKENAPEGAVCPKGLVSVFGTARIEPATRRQKGRDESFIEENDEH